MFATDTETIPADLDAMEPGLILAAVLSSIDVTRLSGPDRVTVLRAHDRMASHHEGQRMTAIAAVADALESEIADPRWAGEAAAAEIRAALRLTRRAADDQLGLALALRDRLPAVWERLVTGAIDLRRTRVMVAGTCHLDDETARVVIAAVIDRAPRLTTGQLAARIRKLCMDVDPDEAAKRYENALDGRRLVTEPTPDGTVNLLGMDLPPDRVSRISHRIDHLARSLRSPDEVRTMDQLRSDVFLDILDGTVAGGTGPNRTGSSRSGGVEITVDLDTLTRLADHPGDLAGYGPVIADIARQVVEGQTDTPWRYTVTHPDSEQPLHTGTTRRRPAADQRRAILAGHRTCVFPGCRIPATGCDIDHSIPYAEGGPTSVTHCRPLCSHDHHTNRHRLGWHYTPLPDGDHLWTSPLGLRYTTSGRPPPQRPRP